MPRPVAWILLVLALTGPLLTHAEAADDLGRLLVESGELSGIGTPDGGVGDDPVVVSSWKAGPTLDGSTLAPLATEATWTFAAMGVPAELDLDRHPTNAASWRYPAIPRRHALLQHFLI